MTQLTKQAYQQLIDGDIELLQQLSNSPEKSHIIAVLQQSVDLLYSKASTSLSNALLEESPITEEDKDSIRSMKEFFTDDIDNHLKAYQRNAQFKEVIDEQSFAVGRTLLLEVEVTNKFMSNYLFRWLYANAANKTYFQVMGCKLMTLHSNNPMIEYKDKIIEFIKSL